MSDRRTYTPEQREEALQLYVDVGPAEAARRTGIPAKTIQSWGGRSGVQSAAVEKTEAAVAAASLTIAQRKQRLASDLLDDIDLIRRRLRAAHVERKIVTLTGGLHDKGSFEIVEVEHPTVPTSDLKALVTSVAILVDKLEVLAPAAAMPPAADGDTEVSEVASAALRLVAGAG